MTTTLLSAAAWLSACQSLGSPPSAVATIERTAHGVAHISAPDVETLAYATAYAHAQDNVCQTAQQLVTVRGERSRHFGGAATGLLGLRARLYVAGYNRFLADHGAPLLLTRP